MVLIISAAANPVWSQQPDSVDDQHNEQPASLSLFVFVDQIPIKGVKVLLNGEALGATDDSGRLIASIPVGEQTLGVKSQDYGSVQRKILFTDNEVIQILINLFADARNPFIDIETSNPNKTLATSTAEQQQDAVPGFLEGLVTSAEDGSLLAGVRVFVSGTPQEFTTDENGFFRFELLPGEYAISVLAARFNTRTLEGIPVTTQATTSQNLELTPAGSELPEFVVIVPYVAGSLASVLEERREEAAVADYLGAEQISRNGDGNVASALRRVTGLTLVNGQFVFIRGLGERYSATLLNGADIPSPDPTRRVVPLDLFPTSIVQSIEVQKGFTPDQVADFGGGVVEIRTNSIPEEDFFRIAISGSYNGQTTFKDGLRSDGGGVDIFGFDDGSRAIPAGIEQALNDGNLFPFSPFINEGLMPDELEALGEALPVNYTVAAQTIEPGFGLDLSGGMRFDFGWFKLGWLAAASLSNEWQTTSQLRRVFGASGPAVEGESNLVITDDQVFDITERSVDLSGFSSVGAQLGEFNNITFNGILLRNTTDENEIQTGFDNEFSTDVINTQIEFEERELQFYQFVGQHIIPWWNESTFDWQYSLSEARSDIPDFRTYRFELDSSNDLFEFATLANGNERSFTELDDSGESLNLDFAFNVGDLGSNYHGTVKVGYSNVKRDRVSQIRRVRFQASGPLASTPGLRLDPLDEILNPSFIDPEGFEIEDNTSASDFYTADLSNESFYYGLDLSLFGFLRVYGGVRDEDFLQEVQTFDPLNAADEPLTATTDTQDLLPGVSTTLNLPWEIEVRLGYAQTVNRPQFRELTPAPFVDPILDSLAVGNPELQPAEITHYDFRIDKYFSELEFISLSFFYKEFSNPIEQQILTGPDSLVTFGNVSSAENLGFEFEFYKDLSFIGGFWENLYLSANFAYIDSSVNIDFAGSTILTSSQRALQGQSPFVINTQIGYSSPDNGITATLLYNTSGERIIQVGTFDRPDIFEQPFNQLDFVVRYSLDDWVFRLNMQNLLNDNVRFTQGSEVTRNFKRGRGVTLGVQYTFN